MQEIKITPRTIEETMSRYPRLTAHLICESLGYFTPRSAANAIKHYKEGEPYYCEWYCHMAGGGRPLLEVGKDTIKRAFQRRSHHVGYMAHYPDARIIVEHVREGGKEPLFASWF